MGTDHVEIMNSKWTFIIYYNHLMEYSLYWSKQKIYGNVATKQLITQDRCKFCLQILFQPPSKAV